MTRTVGFLPEKDPFPSLLKQARAGSTEAMGQVLEHCRRQLLSVANRRVDDDLQAKGGASDIVQETFLEAQRDFFRFQGQDEVELRKWLCRIMLNNLHNFVRQYRDTAKRAVVKEFSLDDFRFLESPGLNLADNSPSPSKIVARSEEAEALERALSSLPEHYRLVIQWRHRDRQSFVEIAQKLDRTEAATRKVWSRALWALADRLRQAGSLPSQDSSF